MTTPAAHRATSRLFRALIAFSAHQAETYTSVWGARAQRTHRTAEDIALHA